MPKNSYPWHTLVNVGDSFTLTEADGAGLKFARQLCYAKNATAIRGGKVDRYSCTKVVEGMEIRKIA